ncbi:MAG: flavodoxin domain-containing protein [Bacteroidota bacterium]|jgi:flavodoxin I
MNNTILIYWPKGGNVENAARMVAKEYVDLKMLSIDQLTPEMLSQYTNFIVGSSTLGAETWQDTKTSSPWNSFFDLIKKSDFSKKKVALFGLGDQVLWPANFVDGLRSIYNAFIDVKAAVVGKWPTNGYDFTDSLAVDDNKFVGLALDEDQQDELTEGRIKAWVKQIKEEF